MVLVSGMALFWGWCWRLVCYWVAILLGDRMRGGGDDARRLGFITIEIHNALTLSLMRPYAITLTPRTKFNPIHSPAYKFNRGI